MIKKLLLIVFLLPCSFAFSQAADVTALIKSGEAKTKSGNFQGAVDDYTQAIKLNEEETAKYLKKLEQVANLTAFEKASLESAELFELRPELAVPYYGRGTSLAALGKKEEAIKDIEMAIKIDSKNGDAYCELGLIKHAMGKKDEGCIDLRTGADLGSAKAKDEYENKFCWNTSLNYAKDGNTKLKLRQYEAAITDFNLAVKLNSDSAINYLRRGQCYMGLGKFDKALADFVKASEVEPKRADCFYFKGLVLYSMEKHQEAFDELSVAIKMNPNYYDAYLYRGYSCEGLGQFKSAQYDYTQAIRIKPNEGLAYYRSGLMKQEMNDKKGACADFKKAAELGNEDAEGYVAECK